MINSKFNDRIFLWYLLCFLMHTDMFGLTNRKCRGHCFHVQAALISSNAIARTLQRSANNLCSQLVMLYLCHMLADNKMRNKKKRTSLRPIYSLGLHISGMRDVAKIYLGVRAGLNVHILIEKTATIGQTRYFRVFNVWKILSSTENYILEKILSKI